MRIRNAFFLSFLICSLISILIALGLSHWNLKQQIKHYVHEKTAQDFEPVIEQLLSRYDPIEGWQYYENRSRRLIDDVVLTLESPEQYGIMPPPPRRGRPDGPRGDRGSRGENDRNQRRAEHITERSNQRAINSDSRNSDSRRRPNQPDIALLNTDNTVIAGNSNTLRDSAIRLELINEEQVIGILAIGFNAELFSDLDQSIRQQQLLRLPLVVLISIIWIGLCAIFMTRYFTAPIAQLSALASRLTQGNYQQNDMATRRDELGDLAIRLNELATVLQSNETRRKHWLADISHELRTPVAILKGEIEALLDGVRPLTKEAISSLEDDIKHLQKLIEDLYQLSNTEAGGLRYQKSLFDLGELIQSAIEKHRAGFAKQGIELKATIPDSSLMIEADEDRILQVIDNLLTNSCKYTDSNGTCHVSLDLREDTIECCIADSSPGVETDALSKLFDHLFRTEASRNKQFGGSGLGLSICAQILAAHNGTIWAEHSPLGGVSIIWQLPREDYE